jgi:hypothetical protein
MTTQQQNKEFDCIASKREAQDQIYQETKEMSPDQQIQYFRNAVENSRLGGWWKKATPFSGNHVNKAS